MPTRLTLEALIASLEQAIRLAIDAIMVALRRNESKAQVKRDVQQVFSRLDSALRDFSRLAVPIVLTSAVKEAEKQVGAEPARITQEAGDAVVGRFYAALAPLAADAQRIVEGIIDSGYRQGMSVADGAVFQRQVADAIGQSVHFGSQTYSLEAGTRALVRTRVNELTNSAHLERYKLHGVTEVEFHFGTRPCTFTGRLGKTCEQLNGDRRPIDDVHPGDGWMPPRHLHSNSRILPVL